MSVGNGQEMKCACGGDLDAVVDSRPRLHKDFGQIIARRRKCSKCGERSTTFEIPETTVETIVENARRDIAKEIMTKLLDGLL